MVSFGSVQEKVRYSRGMKLPEWLQAVKDVWMKFSHAIGFVMSKILLTVLWIVVFGIYGIVHMIGKMFSEAPAPKWLDMDPEFEDSMRHQF